MSHRKYIRMEKSTLMPKRSPKANDKRSSRPALACQGLVIYDIFGETEGFLSEATYINVASTVLLYLGVIECSFLDMMSDIYRLMLSDDSYQSPDRKRSRNQCEWVSVDGQHRCDTAIE